MHDPFQLEGRVLDGKYRLEGVIGEGGFGVVYAGRQIALDQPVAVKCLKPAEGGMDANGNVASFLREARVLFQLSHPGIVRMYDLGEISSPQGPMPYVVLERLAGRTLDEEIDVRGKERRPFTGEELGKLADGLLEALAFAHAQGVVHRDIKPSNVMIVPGPNGPTPKILDFGLARGGVTSRSTTSGGVGLTPRYAAPEQWNANYGAVGPSTDLFALGLVLEEAATLEPALAGESIAEVVASTTSPTRRSRVSQRRPDLPGFGELLDRATRVAQSERFPSALAMRDVMRTLVSNGPWSAGLGPRPSHAPHGSAPTNAPPSPLAMSYGMAPSAPSALAPSRAPAPRPVAFEALGSPSVAPMPAGPPPAAPFPTYAPPQGPPPVAAYGAPSFAPYATSHSAGPPPVAVYDGRQSQGQGGLIGGVLALVAALVFLGALVLAGAGYALYRFAASSEAPLHTPVAPASTPVTPLVPGAPAASVASAADPALNVPTPASAPRSARPQGSTPNPAPTPTPAPAPSAPPRVKAYGSRVVASADLGPKEAEVRAAVTNAAGRVQHCFEGAGLAGRGWNVTFRKTLSGGYGLGKGVTRLDGQVRSLDEGGPASDLRNCTDNILAMTAFPAPPPVKLPDGGTRTPYVEFVIGRE